jgi:hypothetical protein
MNREMQQFTAKTFFRTVELRLLRQLLERHEGRLQRSWGYFECPDEITTRHALLTFFIESRETFPRELLDDLHRINMLSTDGGREILFELANEVGTALCPPEPWSHYEEARLTPRHIALKVFIDYPGVFADALKRMPFRSSDRPAEFIGEDEQVEVNLDESLSDFTEAAHAHYRAIYQGEYCTVEHYEDGGALHLLLGHGKKPISRLAVDEERNEAYPLCFREVAHDTMVFVPETGRIFIKARTDGEKRCLADLFASTLLRRPMFFQHAGSRELYTPRPILNAGREFLMRPCHQGIHAAFVTYLHVSKMVAYQPRPEWTVGMYDRTNAVRRMYDDCPNIRWNEVALDQVDFQFILNDRRHPNAPRKRRTVKLKFPNVLIYDRSTCQADAILQELAAHGFANDTKGHRPDAIDLCD